MTGPAYVQDVEEMCEVKASSPRRRHTITNLNKIQKHIQSDHEDKDAINKVLNKMLKKC